jgi:hypothetical protein
MEIRVMQVSATFPYFLPLGFKYFCQHVLFCVSEPEGRTSKPTNNNKLCMCRLLSPTVATRGCTTSVVVALQIVAPHSESFVTTGLLPRSEWRCKLKR